MKRFVVIASGLLLIFGTALHAASPKEAPAPAPDFWYVVPGEGPATGASSAVQGIVVPSSVHPTVQTSRDGSVLSWRRPDGTRQSFVVRGVSEFTFEPGPIAGTTYVPFFNAIIFQQRPRTCCSCASWQNMVESFELLGCVPGCQGCGCEACICSPTPFCPVDPEGGMTLVAHNNPSLRMTFDTSGAQAGVAVASRGETPAAFRGKNLSTSVAPEGEIVFNNPDSITLSGRVESHASVGQDKSFFAWSSRTASVIVEQPRSMPAPSFHDGIIEFNARAADTTVIRPRRLEIGPVMDRCSVCGTHPDSDGDVDTMQCVPGFSVCYRCISWEC